MFKSNSKSVCAFFVVFVFSMQLIGSPTKSFAEWHSKADELPGFTTGEFVKITLGIAAVTALFIIISKNSKNKDKEQDNQDSTSVKSALANSGQNDTAVNTNSDNLMYDNKLKVGMYFDYRNSDENMKKANLNFSNKTVKVGLSFNF